MRYAFSSARANFGRTLCIRHGHGRSHPFWGYGVALATVGIALALDTVFGPTLFSHISFIALAAVAVTAVSTGYGPGLLAAALSILSLYYLCWAPADGQGNALGVAATFRSVVLILAYGGGTIRRPYIDSLHNAAELKTAVDGRNELLSVWSQDFRTRLNKLKLNYGVRRILMQSAAPKIDQGVARRFNLADREISRLTTLLTISWRFPKVKQDLKLSTARSSTLSDLAWEIADSFQSTGLASKMRT